MVHIRTLVEPHALITPWQLLSPCLLSKAALSQDPVLTLHHSLSESSLDRIGPGHSLSKDESALLFSLSHRRSFNYNLPIWEDHCITIIMHTATLFTAALASAASATKLGFNYGSTFTTGAAKMQSDFENEFTTAANLKGTKGWTGARLYTMVVSSELHTPYPVLAWPCLSCPVFQH